MVGPGVRAKSMVGEQEARWDTWPYTPIRARNNIFEAADLYTGEQTLREKRKPILSILTANPLPLRLFICGV
jgi:hypothetical protein